MVETALRSNGTPDTLASYQMLLHMQQNPAFAQSSKAKKRTFVHAAEFRWTAWLPAAIRQRA